MSVLVVLLALSMMVAGGFLVAFLWAVRKGQFDDHTTPPMRILFEEENPKAPPPPVTNTPKNT